MPDHGRLEAVKDSHVVMVDQLWIWAVDARERDLLPTCLISVTVEGPPNIGILLLTKY